MSGSMVMMYGAGVGAGTPWNPRKTVEPPLEQESLYPRPLTEPDFAALAKAISVLTAKVDVLQADINKLKADAALKSEKQRRKSKRRGR